MESTRLVVSRDVQDTPSTPVSATFTGTAWLDVVIPRQDGVNVGDVHFSPCARTYWHAHEGGQLLLVRSGEGYVGDETGAVRVTAGDTVWTPPGVLHWHGASSGRFMMHTAVSIGGVTWGDPVSDEHYLAGQPHDGE